MNRKPIRNENYNISEGDVQVCEDLTQLREWRANIQADIDAMDGKIAHEEYKDESDRNDRWLKGIKHARKIQCDLIKMIEAKAVNLRNLSMNDPYFVEVNFREEANKAVQSGEMSPELYEMLDRRAKMGYEDGQEG